MDDQSELMEMPETPELEQPQPEPLPEPSPAKPRKPRKPGKGKRGRPKKSASRRAKPLPHPIDPASAPAEQPKSGLFGKLLGRNQSSKPSPAGESSGGSGAVPSDVQAQLDRIPDTIAEQPGEEHQGEAAISSGDIRNLMEMVAFEEQDIRDLLTEGFEWLADRFQSEHWKLTERQGRMLGKPAAQLANSLWQKLCVYLPEVLGAWIANTPGAAATLMACGVVIGPKVMLQVRLNRQRRGVPNKSAPAKPAPQPMAEAGGIPASAGMVS